MEQSEKESIMAASGEASREFKTLVDAEDLDSLKQLQHLILGRLQDSNAVLSHFNEYSENCFAEFSGDISRNTRLLKSMKSDLDYVFQKLRSMKSKISATYPDAFADDSTTDIIDRRPDLEMPKERPSISQRERCRKLGQVVEERRQDKMGEAKKDHHF
ncbi:kxDL motif-containing protein 1-like [Quillaja saponaria]|uniref:KxDL motif-containing protein 1-like n=1 Tax=Quillaja saponaria TaxID=32244 RepID=A0AAD7M363_QUISA|nr:kxDL motif-containing protein 1-like [Quillaja saponaria]